MAYRLISDDDGRYYICPAERYDEGREMLDAHYAFWARSINETMDLPEPPMPDFLERMTGPLSSIKFTSYEIV